MGEQIDVIVVNDKYYIGDDGLTDHAEALWDLVTNREVTEIRHERMAVDEYQDMVAVDF